ncbi:MAG: lipid-A-disaccharide synthase, partial [Candidatus Cloacimonetes bacterium]|nr:lipid-A-disaccharide synthase [Candidatus Cloacimonadota bacterium]
MKQIFWIAGENSGDLHSSKVIEELQIRKAKFKHFGIGGSRMQDFGFKPIFPFERFSVMGFLEVLKHLFFFIKVENKIKQTFQTNPPDLVILVDYPGLNMRIAKIASKMKIPVLYYICPQFWAWKQKRIFQLKKYTNFICYILPFEQKFMEEHQIKSKYVGHPIAKEIEIKLSKKEFAEKYNLDLHKKWLGFFPGSRNSEIKKMLPVFLKTIKKFDIESFHFLISEANSINRTYFERKIQKLNHPNLRIIENYNYEMMKHCDFLTVTSGTATLETAYIGTPFIIVYKTSRISYEIGKRFIKIRRIGLPNIVMDKDILP